MRITKPYTVFVNIPVVQNEQGRYFTDPLWAKDILLHTDYIDCFNLCCPVEQNSDINGLVDITEYNINNIIPLRKDYGLVSVIKNIIPNFLSVIGACKNSDIVHSAGAGWAFPLSFYILPLKPLLKFQWIIVIESSFWLLSKNDKKTFRSLFEHFTHKYILMACVRMADARIFTQSFYRNLFLGDSTKNTMINPASWFNQSNLITLDERKKIHETKSNDVLTFLFPARLEEEKGVKLLFDAINLLANKNIKATIDIIGEGTLKSEAIAFSKQPHGGITVNYLEPVEYGNQFFKLLRHYDLVLVPNIKEEQPRIIFDAFSQGVGVIAANTTGILDIVVQDVNAYIFKANDSQDFSNTLIKAINNSNAARHLGLAGLNYANGKTHLNMHKERLEFLNSALNL